MTGARSGSGTQELVERALAMTRGDACAVIAEEATEANLRWANSTLTTNGVAHRRSMTVISIMGAAAGVVTCEGVGEPGQVADLVEAADRAARAADAAEDAAPLLASHGGKDGGALGWEQPPTETSIAVFDRLAPDLGAGFERAAAAGYLLNGFASYDLTTTFVATSAGVRNRFEQPTGHLEINARSQDGARSTWAGIPNDFRDIDLASVYDDLERRLPWGARRVDLPPGRYDTILPPSAVADFMVYLYWSSGARPAADGRSVFSRAGGGTRVGERLTAAPLTLRSDPGESGLECSPVLAVEATGSTQSVFDNGAPLTPTAWVSDGVLAALVQTRHTSASTGLAFTPYIDNLILEGARPDGDLDRLIATTERGLLVTCLWYIREVDPRTLLLTGLTRDGVYLIEGGEITGAVNNFRFNESPLDVLARADLVGTTTRSLPREWADNFTRTATPAVRVAGFNMSSVGQAS